MDKKRIVQGTLEEVKSAIERDLPEDEIEEIMERSFDEFLVKYRSENIVIDIDDFIEYEEILRDGKEVDDFVLMSHCKRFCDDVPEDLFDMTRKKMLVGE